MPCGTALLQPAPWQGPGSTGSCHLAKGASPALLTGTWEGLLLGTKGAAKGPDTCPEYRARTLAAHQHHRQRGRPPRPWLQVGHAAHAAAKGLGAVLRKQGQGRMLSPPVHFGHPPVAAQSSSFPPGKSKLHCSISKGGAKAQARFLTHTNLGEHREGEHRGGEDSPRRGSKFCAANLL